MANQTIYVNDDCWKTANVFALEMRKGRQYGLCEIGGQMFVVKLVDDVWEVVG